MVAAVGKVLGKVIGNISKSKSGITKLSGNVYGDKLNFLKGFKDGSKAVGFIGNHGERIVFKSVPKTGEILSFANSKGTDAVSDVFGAVMGFFA